MQVIYDSERSIHVSKDKKLIVWSTQKCSLGKSLEYVIISLIKKKKNLIRTKMSTKAMTDCFAQTLRNLRTIIHKTFPATLTVLWVVSNGKYVMAPRIFPRGLRVNAAYYKMLERFVTIWIESMIKDRDRTAENKILCHNMRTRRPMNEWVTISAYWTTMYNASITLWK